MPADVTCLSSKCARRSHYHACSHYARHHQVNQFFVCFSHNFNSFLNPLLRLFLLTFLICCNLQLAEMQKKQGFSPCFCNICFVIFFNYFFNPDIQKTGRYIHRCSEHRQRLQIRLQNSLPGHKVLRRQLHIPALLRHHYILLSGGM